MRLRPIGGHIIVEPREKEEKTASGIYLPATGEQSRPEQGKVIAVGPGKQLESGMRQAMEIKEGDVVVFKSYSTHEIEVDTKKLFVIPAEEVMAVVEE